MRCSNPAVGPTLHPTRAVARRAVLHFEEACVPARPLAVGAPRVVLLVGVIVEELVEDLVELIVFDVPTHSYTKSR